MKKTVAVAMSGGVESSVAAALLQQAGYDVIGLTMRFNLSTVAGSKASCGAQGIRDARRVARALGIKHYVFDFGRQMQEKVIADFVRQYRAGLTPNPCVRCNEYLKFDGLLRKALGLGAQCLATGHYARITRARGTYFLKKAGDVKKDQSYFLYRLTQEKLKRVLFPLGGYTKEQVRRLADEFKLPVARKAESQEICFVPGTYQEFIAGRLKPACKTGSIVDSAGKVLGQHQGIAFYTIGQRDKLGIACGYPVYVSRIDPAGNTITVGKKEELMRARFRVTDLVWPSGRLRTRKLLRVRIRHLSPESAAWVIPGARGAEVRFKEPRFAITPGQSAVFYAKDTVVGGGIIEKVLA